MSSDFIRRRFEVQDGQSNLTFSAESALQSRAKGHVAVVGPDGPGVAALAAAVAAKLRVPSVAVETAEALLTALGGGSVVVAVSDAALVPAETEKALTDAAVVFYRMGGVIGADVDESIYFRLATHLVPAHPDTAAVADMAMEKLSEASDFAVAGK